MLQDLDCRKCIVRSSTCFSDLMPDDIGELVEKKISTVYKKGQTIFYEGMMPTGIYCLHSGKIKISKRGNDGKEQIVRFVLEGGLLGIRSLMGGRKYSASATTLEESVVCYIDQKTFFKLTTKYPHISQCVVTLICALLEEAEAKMTSLAQKPVRERLAEGLLILDELFNGEGGCKADEQEHALSLSREDLANLVGTATETVIRLLSDFKDEKFIEIEGRKIILMDKEGLKKTSNNLP
ncbi:MAG: Crp/Fnr family transcriptional regulator [Bacteroidetes bacterium]|nr:MAG: Crp/Fnr family transcriptional regulator [Bacteroidota bacterium]